MGIFRYPYRLKFNVSTKASTRVCFAIASHDIAYPLVDVFPDSSTDFVIQFAAEEVS